LTFSIRRCTPSSMKPLSIDKELEAIGIIIHALESLDEPQRLFVLKTVTERLGVSLPINNSSAGGGAGGAATPNSPVSGGGKGGGSLDAQTPKQFLKAKLPKTDVQRVACLAYYLANHRSQPHFKTEDITSLNTEAGGQRLSNPHLAVNNALHQNGYFAPVGGGNKQITGLGEDVVEALPDQEAVKAVSANQKKPRRKPAKKSPAKTK
jgi:hypothetical protein